MPAGACRCCLAAGRFRSVWRRYAWLGEAERYADLLRDALHVQIPEQDDSRDGAVICAVCITRLRDAYNFKKQVLACGLQLAEVSEKKEGAVESELVPNVQPADRSSEEAPPETEQTASNDELIELYELEQPENSQAADEGDDGTADNDEEYIIAIEVEDEDGARLSQLPSGFEIPIIKSVKRHKRRLPEEAGTSRRKRPRSASQETPECVTVKAENSEEKIVRKTSSRGPRRVSQVKLEKQYPEKIEDNWMRVNASIIIANSEVCPFNAQHNCYKCFYCTVPFDEPARLREHTAMEHRNDKLSSLKYMKNYSQVLIDITNQSCSLCEESFQELNQLIDHLSGMHELSFNSDYGSGVIPFILDELRCHICKQTFYTFEVLNRHMNEHLGSFVCYVCGFSYASYTRLYKHMLTHQRGNYKCDRCEKVFDTYRKRTVHIERTHDKIKAAVCNICSERFSDYDQKVRHLIEVHDEQQRVYRCQFCPKEYKSRRFVMNHTRRDHLKVRNNKCQFCSKKFYLKSQLDNHMVTHTKEKLFQCDECKKKFNRKSSLLVHMRLHYFDKRNFLCDICDAEFTTKAKCMYHRKKHHQNAVLYYPAAKTRLSAPALENVDFNVL